MRFVPNVVEVGISEDGVPLISRVFTTGTEAVAWAEEEGEACESGEP